MHHKNLEIRGIPLSQLIIYLRELGGEQLTDPFPVLIKGDKWQAELLRQEEAAITSRFRVNAVFLVFKAPCEEVLDDVVARFRKKTIRVGG
ncbi:hypothetical protein [Brevibacillus massiliensis]|jgi:hypothetical protein|uniref:hypothetical protein n=1 Tax=Brevibacillus massiliensis TaxID=1118054 RepID=UPI0002FB59A0|nr:hypothetical protein [Brevibacillus massiliensis]